MQSMTGCGQFVEESDQWRVTTEIRSVNNRYLDISVKLPKQYISFEEKIKKIISNSLNRGKVDIFLTIEQIGEKNCQLVVDKDLALAYYSSVQVIADLTGLSNNTNVSDIAAYYGVLTLEKGDADLNLLWQTTEASVNGALHGICAMRAKEGQRLAADMEARLHDIGTLKAKIAERSPLVVSEYRDKLKARMQEILQQVDVDEARLLNEVAFFTDKADITEELIRLDSHLQQFNDTLHLSGPTGRKLDFILQEINREINTIGSKANDLEIGRLVIEAKSELEKIREQVQNVE